MELTCWALLARALSKVTNLSAFVPDVRWRASAESNPEPYHEMAWATACGSSTVTPNVAKVEDARDPRHPRVRLGQRFVGNLTSVFTSSAGCVMKFDPVSLATISAPQHACRAVCGVQLPLQSSPCNQASENRYQCWQRHRLGPTAAFRSAIKCNQVQSGTSVNK